MSPAHSHWSRAVAEGPDPGLKDLSGATGGGYFELTSTADLAATFRQIANELHHQYALGFTPAVVTLVVANTGDRPVQVGSHFHFAQANAALRFDRDLAWGRRLNVPAGTAVRFEPGVEREVSLVPLAGRRVVPGLQVGGRRLNEAAG